LPADFLTYIAAKSCAKRRELLIAEVFAKELYL